MYQLALSPNIGSRNNCNDDVLVGKYQSLLNSSNYSHIFQDLKFFLDQSDYNLVGSVDIQRNFDRINLFILRSPFINDIPEYLPSLIPLIIFLNSPMVRDSPVFLSFLDSFDNLKNLSLNSSMEISCPPICCSISSTDGDTNFPSPLIRNSCLLLLLFLNNMTLSKLISELSGS